MANDRHKFTTTVARTIARHKLLRREGRVVVAVSGGADSVALLAALTELGYECVAAHCNFHLRGEESMRDMRFTERLAAQLGVDLHIRDFNVEARCRATGESVEMACRELRYKWFEDLLESNRAQAIAVGHHREDSVETFFLNLLRGSGLTGLTGIAYRRGLIVRPALDTSREMIEDYLHSRGLGWVDDSTNASSDFKRNAIRNRLIPLLEEIAPGATDAVLDSMSHLHDARRIVDNAVVQTSAEYMADNGDTMRIADLVTESEIGEILAAEILRRRGFNPTQAANMAASASASGKEWENADGLHAELDHGVLHIASGKTPEELRQEWQVEISRDITTPIHIASQMQHITAFKPERDASVMYLDASVLDEPHAWTIRHPRRGDRIEPFGMTGSKLISDLFAEARYSNTRKRQAWILTCDGKPAWVVGLRAWRKYTITPETAFFIKLVAE